MVIKFCLRSHNFLNRMRNRFYFNNRTYFFKRKDFKLKSKTSSCFCLPGRVVPLDFKWYGVVLVFKARKPRSLPEATQKAAPPYPGPTRDLQFAHFAGCGFVCIYILFFLYRCPRWFALYYVLDFHFLLFSHCPHWFVGLHFLFRFVSFECEWVAGVFSVLFA